MKKYGTSFFAAVVFMFHAGLMLPTAARASTVTLDGVVVYDGANDGFGATGSTVNYGHILYIAPNSPDGEFINQGAGGVHYNLSVGTNRFYHFVAGVIPNWPLASTFGIGVYINQSASPSLSGETEANYGTRPTFSSSPLYATTPGSLSFQTGNFLVELTDFNWNTPSATGSTGYQRVSPFSPTPSGWANYVGAFTLQVTDLTPAPVPLPPALLLCASGLGAFRVFGRSRKRRDQSRTDSALASATGNG